MNEDQIIAFLEDQIVSALARGNIINAQILRAELAQIQQERKHRDLVSAPPATPLVNYSLN